MIERDALPPHARALLDAASDADDPSAADRKRIEAVFSPKLAALGVVPALLVPAPLAAAPVVTTAVASSSGLGMAAKLAIVLVGAGVAAGGLVATREQARTHATPQAAQHVAAASYATQAAAPSAMPLAPAQAPVEPIAATQPDLAPVAVPAVAVVPAAWPPADSRTSMASRRSSAKSMHAASRFIQRTRRAPAPATAPAAEAAAAPEPTPPAVVLDPSLREEIALIDRASDALRKGRAGEAIHSLDEHESRFAHGALSEERRGLRVLALCKTGPHGLALEARAAFLRDAPHSLLAPKVRAACADGAAPSR